MFDPQNSHEFDHEQNEMFELCIQVFKGRDLRECLGLMIAQWDVSPHSARLMLVAFKAGMEFGCDLAVEPVAN